MVVVILSIIILAFLLLRPDASTKADENNTNTNVSLAVNESQYQNVSTSNAVSIPLKKPPFIKDE